MKNQKKINFILNGERISTSFKPGESALDIIRERLGITAVKQGCEGEGCGACTLIIDDRAVYSCMMPSLTQWHSQNLECSSRTGRPSCP